jgi:hypothetical protein
MTFPKAKPRDQSAYLDSVHLALESDDTDRAATLISQLNPAEIADILESMPPGQRSSL